MNAACSSQFPLGVGRVGRAIRLAFAAVIVALALVLTPQASAHAQDASDVQARSYAGFSDVQPTDWFVESGDLDYAVSHNLLSGYPDGRFGPDDVVSRGQVVTVLWRMAGSPACDTGRFTDVNYGQYYGTAISWARLTGVVSGFGDTNTFAPDDPVTREQLAVMLANYADIIGLQNVASDCTALDAISGSEQVSSWAREQMGWAVDSGILMGEVVDDSVLINPQNPALRSAFAKMATVLLRDVLDGDGCKVANSGVEYYEDQYISMYLPLGWTSFAEPFPMGHTSGAFHVDFYPYDDWTSPFLRVDGARGWNTCQEISPNGNYVGRLAWKYSHGLDAGGWSQMQLETALSYVTGEKLSLSDVGACASETEAADLTQYYASQVRFRVHIK